jgi:hypothetical protein
MPAIPLVLPASTTVGRDAQVANARLINAYPEIGGEDGKSVFAIYGAPGLTRWDTGSYSGAERGFIELSASELIAFLGNQVVSFDAAGIGTTLGNLVGSGRLHLSRNRASPPQISIVTSSGQYFVLQAGAITLNADADLPAPNSTTYLKGRTIFGIADGRFFASAVDDATSINALAFDVADSNSDALVRVFENAGFLYVFGLKSLEIWQADPSLAGQPFPFSPVQQDIEYGLGGAHTVAKFEKAMIWVDQNNMVRYGRDGSAERASNHAVERSIEALTTTQKAAMVGSVHAWQGHETYTLKGANFTWCLDLPLAKKQGFEKAWYMRQSYGLDRWRTNSAIQFAGKYILGDESDGRLYYLDPAAQTENGADHVMEIWCPHSHRFPQRMVVDALEVDMVSGVGASTEGGGIHFSDDAYVDMGDVLDRTSSFTVEALVDVGAIGTAAQRIIAKDDGLTGWAMSLGDNGSGSLRFFHRQLNSVITDTVSFPTSGYAHAAAVFDAAADTVTLYIDGAQAGQTTGQTNAISGNGARLTIGSAPDADLNSLTGFISNVRIWNIARTEAQILANMFTELTGGESGLVGYWKLDEQAGAVAADSSPSGFDGALTGFAIWASQYQAAAATPRLMVDFSDDGGKTFGGERTASFGKQGDYSQTIRLNRWGRCTKKGRIWRLRASAAVLRAINSASIWARPAK